MAVKAEFTVKPDQLKFTTQTNGDYLEFARVHLGAESAANLAYLINTPDGDLVVKIKLANDEES